jgi:hypothetical protein
MRRAFLSLNVFLLLSGCANNQEDAKSPVASSFSALTSPISTISIVGMDTLSDSASIHRVLPEPDGSSVAFLFADATKGITRGLGLVQASGSSGAQLAWPDSVISFWWSGPHQLSFTAGTGQGVHVVVDAHASQLQALEVTGAPTNRSPPTVKMDSSTSAVLSRAQAFIDSIRVQPDGTPQRSTLRYEVDTISLAPSDTFAAVHVLARGIQGTKVNPAWYLVHLPSSHVQAIDSLTGQSPGLPSTAGEWGADGRFYYAKERSIWRAQPVAH